MKPTDHAHGSHHNELDNEDVAHEHSDINVRAVIAATIVIAVVCLVTAALMYGLFWFVLERQAAARDPKLSPLALPATQMPRTTLESPAFGGAPEPRLLTNEPRNLDQVRGRTDDVLHGYGWVDERSGVARIPIEEAKQLVVKRGLPVRPDPIEDPSVGSRLPARGESSSGRVITNPPSTQPAAAAPGPAAPSPAHK